MVWRGPTSLLTPHHSFLPVTAAAVAAAGITIEGHAIEPLAHFFLIVMAIIFHKTKQQKLQKPISRRMPQRHSERVWNAEKEPQA